MRLLSCVQFTVALEVVKPTEPRRALLAAVRLLLAVYEKMALQIVMSGEFGWAVRALVLPAPGWR